MSRIKPAKRKTLANGRNADAPSKRFLKKEHELFQSVAYRSLDLTARALLDELIALHDGSNNGSLWLSVIDATALLGLADSKALTRAFNDLQEAGFIRKTKDAHFSVKFSETSRARCWRLTFLPVTSRSQPATNEWREWSPPARTKARKRMERGMRALKRRRQGESSNKFPVVDSSILGFHDH